MSMDASVKWGSFFYVFTVARHPSFRDRFFLIVSSGVVSFSLQETDSERSQKLVEGSFFFEKAAKGKVMYIHVMRWETT